MVIEQGLEQPVSPGSPSSPSKKNQRPKLTIKVDPPRSPVSQSAAPVPPLDDDMSEFYTPNEFAIGEGFRFEVGQMLGAQDEDVYEDEVELPSPSPSLKPRFTPRRRSISPSQFLRQQQQNDPEREKNMQADRDERDERALLASILALCPSLHTVKFLSGKEWVFIGEGGGVWVRE